MSGQKSYGIGDLPAASPVHDTDTQAICQNPTGCFATDATVTLKGVTQTQLASYYRSKLFAVAPITYDSGAGNIGLNIDSTLSVVGGQLHVVSGGPGISVPTAQLLGGASGALTPVAVGTGLTLTGGTLAATGSGTGNVNSGASLALNQLVIGQGFQNIATLGALGNTNTVLHGNASGAPTFSPVSLTADVSGILQVVNGGTGSNTTGSGVTQVGFTVPAASIYTATGSPVTGVGSLGFTVAGTSGGVPYFNTTSSINTSALLAQYGVVLGGGAGAAPSTLGLGAANSVLTSAGAGAPPYWQSLAAGSGTVIASPQYQLAFYPTTGSVSTVQGTAHISETGTQTLINYNAVASTAVPAANQLVVTTDDTHAPVITSLGFNGNRGLFNAMSASGTGASPTGLAASAALGSYNFAGYDTTATVTTSATLRAFSTEATAFTSANHGTRVELTTTPNGTTSNTPRMGWESNGGITVPPTVSGGGIAPGTINAQGYYLNGVPFTTGGADTVTPGITAHAGGGQALAAALPSQFNVVTTVATSGDSVVLPVVASGTHCLVRNSGANSLAVFPPSGVRINTQALNAAITVVANSTAYFEADAAQWYSVP